MYEKYKIQSDGTPKYDYQSYTVKPKRRIYENTEEWNRRLKGGKTYKFKRRTEVNTVKSIDNKYKKSVLFAIGEVLTLISAIFNTYVLSILIFQSADIFTISLYVLLLVFVWLGRYKSLKCDHKGWMIYSLIIGGVVSNPMDIVGYVLILIYSFKH